MQVSENLGILVQARSGSNRFPNKVTHSLINSITVIEYLIRSLLLVENINSFAVITTKKAIDNKIEKLVLKSGVNIYRGCENNVMKRYIDAANHFKIDTIIRIPGDNPFILPSLISQVVKEWNKNKKKIDYLSTILDDSFPIGMHIEIFTLKALEKAYLRVKSKGDLEHVTSYIYNNPNYFNLKKFSSSKNLSNYRFTIDYFEDLIFSRKLAELINIDKKTLLTDLVLATKEIPLKYHNKDPQKKRRYNKH